MSTYKIEIAEPIVSDLKDFAKRNNITLEEASMRAFALLSIANTASKPWASFTKSKASLPR